MQNLFGFSFFFLFPFFFPKRESIRAVFVSPVNIIQYTSVYKNFNVEFSEISRKWKYLLFKTYNRREDIAAT